MGSIPTAAATGVGKRRQQVSGEGLGRQATGI